MSSQHLLSASNIFEAEDLAHHDEPVPEWKGPDGQPGVVRLVQLNAEESIALTDTMAIEANLNDGMFIVLVFTARDLEGNRLFTMEDVPKLRKKSMRVLNRLQRIALRLNSMLQESEVALKKA